MKIKYMLSLVILLAVMMLPTLLHAQAPDPGGDPDAAVPIDGGLSLLLAAGVGYVAKKGYDAKQKRKDK